MWKSGIIYDIKTVTLLHECGDETIQKVKHDIHRIEIGDVDLSRVEQTTLASVIKKCSPLRVVRIQELWLSPTLLKSLEGCHTQVETFEVSV